MEIKEDLFFEIENIIKKRLYNDDAIKVQLLLREVNSDNEFSIGIKIESREYNLNFDTRVALEDHNRSDTMEGVHIQADIQNVGLENFNNGKMQLFLDVKSENHLLEISKGFVFSIVEVILLLEKKLGYEAYFLVYTFFSKEVLFFKSQKLTLEKLLYNSLKLNTINIKGKKSDNYKSDSKIKIIFLLIQIFKHIELLQPILKNPVLQNFVEIPQIKKVSLSLVEHSAIFDTLILKRAEIEKFTPEKYMLELGFVESLVNF